MAGNIFNTIFHNVVVMELVYLVISRKMKIEKQSDCMLSISTSPFLGMIAGYKGNTPVMFLGRVKEKRAHPQCPWFAWCF